MLNLRTVATATAFVVAAVLAPQAQATLTIDAGGSVGAGGVITGGTIEGTDPTNTFLNPGSFSMNGFNINALSITGENAFGGSGMLMDVSSLDVSTGGSGSLKLFFTETGLTGKSPIGLITDFSANLKDISVTRSLYFDPTNIGSEGQLVATTTVADATISSLPLVFDGTFALIEEIDLTATSSGATLSADDDVSTPEPLSLALFGAGLFGLGLIRRRGRS